MKIQLPKPLHGWREFAGEVGIIVLGVLIALAADQLVDDWQSNRELSEFRSALDKEAAYNLGVYEYRLNQLQCVSKRLGELEQWQARWRSGRAAALGAPIGSPTNLTVRTSVWEARLGDVIGRMPLSERLAHSRVYDSLKTFQDIGQREREVWRELAEFEAAVRLDDAQQMRLHGLIARAKSLNEFIRLNTRFVMRLAEPLNVRPSHDRNEIPPVDNLCEPILQSPRAS